MWIVKEQLETSLLYPPGGHSVRIQRNLGMRGDKECVKESIRNIIRPLYSATAVTLL